MTIATNMAGRGTDIILGGNPETLAWAQLKDKYPTRLDVPDDVWKSTVDAIEAKEKMKEPAAKWRPWAACTSSAPNATKAGVSTTSFAAGPAGRAIRVPRDSTFRCKTN